MKRGRFDRAYELSGASLAQLTDRPRLSRFPRQVRGWAALALGKEKEARRELVRFFAEYGDKPEANFEPLLDRFIRLHRSLDDILAGTYEFRTPTERIYAAWMLEQGAARYARACELMEEAFAEDPTLATVPVDAPNRWHWAGSLAEAALQAADGFRHDAEELPEAERRRLRERARHFMELDLETWWARHEADEPGYDVDATRGQLRQWTWLPRYGVVRHARRLNELPRDEREAWTAFWADVQAKLAILDRK